MPATFAQFKKSFFLLIASATFSQFVADQVLAASSGIYRKATEDDEVVKNKIYPKNKKVEIEGPTFGGILNQSYINTYLVGAGINYFFSEAWGFGIEGMYAMNQDKNARKCIENFYNDPNYVVDDECDTGGGLDSGQTDSSSRLGREGHASYGPAYVPIRETKYMIGANAIWNPVYGKQLFFLSATNYFDIFVIMGGGFAISDFYKEMPTLHNGNISRNKVYDTKRDPDETNVKPGAQPDETGSYGEEGRPEPETSTNLYLNFGIGQKYHFAKRFHIKTELRNYTLVATQSGFDNFFTLTAGLGMRF